LVPDGLQEKAPMTAAQSPSINPTLRNDEHGGDEARFVKC
jgi:hypothetical protein